MEPPNETNPPRPPPSPSFLSLPKDIVLNILARISKSYYQTLSFVSKSFRSLILSDELDMMRSYMRSFIKLVFAPQRFFTTFQPVLPVTLRQTNEELSKLQATTDSDSSSVKGLVNDIASDPLDQPQFPGSDSYDPWYNPVYNQSTPDDVLYQAPIKVVSGLVIAPDQSFSTNFPSLNISLGQTNGGFEFEALTANNFKQYEMWGPQENNNQGDGYTIDGLWDPPQENNNQGDANTIDGSFYMISRKPFDPIGRPCNPFGPIARPLTPFLPS